MDGFGSLSQYAIHVKWHYTNWELIDGLCSYFVVSNVSSIELGVC